MFLISYLSSSMDHDNYEDKKEKKRTRLIKWKLELCLENTRGSL